MKDLKFLLNKRKNLKNITLSEKDIFYIFSKTIKEEFGNIGAIKFQFDFFKNKTLFVRCESAAWSSELWLNREKIIRKMNKELGEGTIERLKTKNS
ncbi:MAG TPA: DUF721 domain-containing protein [Candidatus Moranbacteria bacterium]|nr:DUF721 domain-containing protein [Candidatus Moranbacteria bacterium]